MTGKGIMRFVRRLGLVLVLSLPVAFAQESPAPNRDDLDVTMRVIVDPDAKVPDEIVRRIPLPKPAQPAPAPANPAGDKEKKEPGKPDKPVPPGQQNRPEPPGQQGREFGQQVADDARQRAEEAKRNKPPPPRGPPAAPPGRPPDRPPRNPGG